MSKINLTLVDHMGHDVRVADIARQSFKSDVAGSLRERHELTDKDINLINFLGSGYTSESREKLLRTVMKGEMTEQEAIKHIDDIKHHATHWTPFAHCMISMSCTAPVSIVRQLWKSKIGFVENEVSKRYVDTVPEIFMPDSFRARPEGNIKQGSGQIHPNSEELLDIYTAHCNACLAVYSKLVKEGVAPEQARFVLPQSMMVDWTWTGSLYSWAHLYNLRLDSTVQKETREFVIKAAEIIQPLFPCSWEALTRT